MVLRVWWGWGGGEQGQSPRAGDSRSGTVRPPPSAFAGDRMHTYEEQSGPFPALRTRRLDLTVPQSFVRLRFVRLHRRFSRTFGAPFLCQVFDPPSGGSKVMYTILSDSVSFRPSVRPSDNSFDTFSKHAESVQS